MRAHITPGHVDFGLCGSNAKRENNWCLATIIWLIRRMQGRVLFGRIVMECNHLLPVCSAACFTVVADGPRNRFLVRQSQLDVSSVKVVHRHCFKDILPKFKALALTHGERQKESVNAPPDVAS